MSKGYLGKTWSGDGVHLSKTSPPAEPCPKAGILNTGGFELAGAALRATIPGMLVFLSWSGDGSRKAAEAFAACLSLTLPGVEVFFSHQIAPGDNGREQIEAALRRARVGVVFLTKEAMNSVWIGYESGEIKAGGGRVCPLLLGLASRDLPGPLAVFQHSKPNKDDVLKLLRTINLEASRAGEQPLTETALAIAFKQYWPDLDNRLRELSMPSISAVDDEARRTLEAKNLARVGELLKNNRLPPGDSVKRGLTDDRYGISAARAAYGSNIPRMRSAFDDCFLYHLGRASHDPRSFELVMKRSRAAAANLDRLTSSKPPEAAVCDSSPSPVG